MLRNTLRATLVLLCAFCLSVTVSHANGARLYKSGPIQITADGQTIFTANRGERSISRILTDTLQLRELQSDCTPRGLSVTEDGETLLATCEEEDAILILTDADSSMNPRRIELTWGSRPAFVAISPDQRHAVASLEWSAQLAVIDMARLAVTKLVPCAARPLGIAWSSDGRAFVTHAGSDGENTYVSGLSFKNGEAQVSSVVRVPMQEPQQSGPLGFPSDMAEGGAVVFRGHLAQAPGTREMWIPAMHLAINEDKRSPDTTAQVAIHRIDLDSTTLPPSRRLVLSSKNLHDPVDPAHPIVGEGWDAHASGPIDVAFTADGQMAYVLNENSDDMLAVPTTSDALVGSRGSRLQDLQLGARPVGLVLSPVAELVYVLLEAERKVLVVDIAGGGARIASFRWRSNLPAGMSPVETVGSQIFTSSANRIVSGNQKVACASCHVDAGIDGLTWRFENLLPATGPRATLTLQGMRKTMGTPRLILPNQLHRAGERSSMQDFLATARSPLLGGTGSANDSPPIPGVAYYDENGNSTTASTPMVAVQAWVGSLPPIARSPARAQDGSLSDAAVRGASFFVRTPPPPPDGGAMPGACVSCHVPDTYMVDFERHDVGTYRDPAEVLLAGRSPAWTVNTPTLVSAFATPPFADPGEPGRAPQDLHEFIRRMATRAHGSLAGLSPRQVDDLAEFVRSIDGDMSINHLYSTYDNVPPRVTRVEAASLSRVEVWLSETVEPTSAEDTRNWRIVATDGTDVPILSATPSRWGDRVSLETRLPWICDPSVFTLIPGAIHDATLPLSTGGYNTLDATDPSNVRNFTVSRMMTVTVGASGAESLDVDVEDVAIFAHEGEERAHGSVWLAPATAGGLPSRALVRFDWVDAFRDATGLAAPQDIREASISLTPEWGSPGTVLARRVLQPWHDARNRDDMPGPAGSPTWDYSSYPGTAWNGPGASMLGGSGNVASDYDGSMDLSVTLDAHGCMRELDEDLILSSEALTEAFRFWYAHPSLNHGHALELGADAVAELKFRSSEQGRLDMGPVLTLTYELPAPATPGLPELSGAGAPPLRLQRAGLGLAVSFEDAALPAYGLLEGSIGSWSSHALLSCLQNPATGGGMAWGTITPSLGNRYYLAIRGNDGSACGAGATGIDSLGRERQRVPADCR